MIYINKLAIKLIEWYQNKLSPGMDHRCRYMPSCSEYAKICYQRFNFFKASFLSLFRILRCNPLFKPKYDPPPEKKIRKNKKNKANDNKEIMYIKDIEE